MFNAFWWIIVFDSGWWFGTFFIFPYIESDMTSELPEPKINECLPQFFFFKLTLRMFYTCASANLQFFFGKLGHSQHLPTSSGCSIPAFRRFGFGLSGLPLPPLRSRPTTLSEPSPTMNAKWGENGSISRDLEDNMENVWKSLQFFRLWMGFS